MPSHLQRPRTGADDVESSLRLFVVARARDELLGLRRFFDESCALGTGQDPRAPALDAVDLRAEVGIACVVGRAAGLVGLLQPVLVGVTSLLVHLDEQRLGLRQLLSLLAIVLPKRNLLAQKFCIGHWRLSFRAVFGQTVDPILGLPVTG